MSAFADHKHRQQFSRPVDRLDLWLRTFKIKLLAFLLISRSPLKIAVANRGSRQAPTWAETCGADLAGK